MIENGQQTEPNIVASPPQESIRPKVRLNKKWFMGLGIGLFLLAIAAFFLLSTQKNKPTEKKVSDNQESSLSVTPATQKTESNNPLINEEEVSNIEELYKKKIESSGKKEIKEPEYNFHFKAGPALQSRANLFVQQASAAAPCSLSSLPQTVTVYMLHPHLPLTEAQKIAKSFSLDTSAHSLPGSSTFQYYFTDPASDAYLSISEPSGVYYYHNAYSTTGNADLEQAKVTAQKALTDHELALGAVLRKAELNSDLDKYVMTYERSLHGMTMTDSNAITSLGKTGSVCDVSQSELMNYIEVIVNKENTVFKINNKTRLLGQDYSIARQSLEAALGEYKDKPPVKPIVIGTDTTGDVTISSASFVLYDYGEDYGQVAYIPMYLTSGTTPNGTRVFALFPAVSKENLSKTPIQKIMDSNKQLQLQTFNPLPPKAVAPSGNKCFGHRVDYRITCAQNARTVCTMFRSINSDNDPFNVCSQGCQNKSDVITVAASDNPCSKYLEYVGIPDPYSSGTTGNMWSEKIYNIEAGSVSCSMNACPC